MQFDPRVVNAFVEAYRAGKRPSKKDSGIIYLLKKELRKREEKTKEKLD